MLSMIGGDMESFKKSMLTGRDVMEDAQIASESWVVSLEKMQNAWKATNSVGLEFLDTIVAPFMNFLAEALLGIQKLTTKIDGLGTALMGLSGTLVAIKVATKMAEPATVKIIGLIATTLTMLATVYAKLKKAQMAERDRIKTINKESLSLAKTIEINESITKALDEQLKSLTDTADDGADKIINLAKAFGMLKDSSDKLYAGLTPDDFAFINPTVEGESEETKNQSLTERFAGNELKIKQGILQTEYDLLKTQKEKNAFAEKFNLKIKETADGEKVILQSVDDFINKSIKGSKLASNVYANIYKISKVGDKETQSTLKKVQEIYGEYLKAEKSVAKSYMNVPTPSQKEGIGIDYAGSTSRDAQKYRGSFKYKGGNLDNQIMGVKKANLDELNKEQEQRKQQIYALTESVGLTRAETAYMLKNNLTLLEIIQQGQRDVEAQKQVNEFKEKYIAQMSATVKRQQLLNSQLDKNIYESKTRQLMKQNKISFQGIKDVFGKGLTKEQQDEMMSTFKAQFKQTSGMDLTEELLNQMTNNGRNLSIFGELFSGEKYKKVILDTLEKELAGMNIDLFTKNDKGQIVRKTEAMILKEIEAYYDKLIEAETNEEDRKTLIAIKKTSINLEKDRMEGIAKIDAQNEQITTELITAKQVELDKKDIYIKKETTQNDKLSELRLFEISLYDQKIKVLKEKNKNELNSLEVDKKMLKKKLDDVKNYTYEYEGRQFKNPLEEIKGLKGLENITWEDILKGNPAINEFLSNAMPGDAVSEYAKTLLRIGSEAEDISKKQQELLKALGISISKINIKRQKATMKIERIGEEFRAKVLGEGKSTDYSSVIQGAGKFNEKGELEFDEGRTKRFKDVLEKAEQSISNDLSNVESLDSFTTFLASQLGEEFDIGNVDVESIYKIMVDSLLGSLPTKDDLLSFVKEDELFKIKQQEAQTGLDLTYKRNQLEESILMYKMQELEQQKDGVFNYKEYNRLVVEYNNLQLKKYNEEKEMIKGFARQNLEALATGEFTAFDNSAGLDAMAGFIADFVVPQGETMEVKTIKDQTKVIEDIRNSVSSIEDEKENGEDGNENSKKSLNPIKDTFEAIGKMLKGDFSEMEQAMQGINAVVSTLNMFAQQQANMELESLKWEREILQARSSGATTEIEKEKMKAQLLDNQIQQLEAQYNAKTQFLGTKGTTGGLLGGAMAGAMQGAVSGNLGVAIGMSAVQGIMGGLTAHSEKKKMRREQEMLKLVAEIKAYEKERTTMMRLQQDFYKNTAKMSNKIGIEDAINTALMERIRQTGKITGSGSTDWNNRTHHGGLTGAKNGSWEARKWQSSKTLNLKDLYIPEIQSRKDLETALGQVRQQREALGNKRINARTGTKSMKDFDKFVGSDWGKIDRGWEADKLSYYRAMKSLEENLAKQLKISSKIEKATYSSYFGATLAELGKDGIEGYEADWTNFKEEILSDSVSNAFAGTTGNKFGNNFIKGMTAAFVQNKAKLNKIFMDLIQPAYEGIGEAMRTDNKGALQKYLKDLQNGINQYEKEQERANAESAKFITMWIDSGGKVSSIIDSMTNGAKNMVNSLNSIFSEGDASKGFSSLLSGDLLGGMVESNYKSILDSGTVSRSIKNLNSLIGKVMGGDQGAVGRFTELYSQLADIMSDPLRNKDQLGLTNEEIKKLQTQIELEEQITEEMMKRISLKELGNKRQQQANDLIVKMQIELKNTGQISDYLKDKYDEIVNKITGENESIKTTMRDFTQQWLNGTISGTFDTVKDNISKQTDNLITSMQEAFSSDTFGSMASGIGDSIASDVIEGYTKQLVNEKYKQRIAEVNSKLFGMLGSAENGDLSMIQSSLLAQEVRRLSVEMETDRRRIESMKNIFDFNREIRLNTTERQMNYQASSTKESVYNITNSNTFQIGNYIANDMTLKQFAEALAPYIAKATKRL